MSSTETVGTVLANEVAARLEEGKVLAYSHRDYCGMGLRYVGYRFIYGEVNDGELPSESEMRHWQEAGDIERKTFNSKSEFVSWLALQSDDSLSGTHLERRWLHNNQRITLERLRQFAVGRG